MISYKRAITSWLLVSIFYAYQYVLRVIPNIIVEDVISMFKIDEELYGQFSGIYYIGYAIMHLPVGIMLDRIGARKTLSLSIIVTAIGSAALLIQDNFLYPLAGRFLIGAGSSAAVLGIFKVVRVNFPTNQSTKMISIAVTIGLVGAIYGGAPVSYLKDNFGFEQLIVFITSLGLVLGVMTFICMADMNDSADHVPVLSNLKLVFKNYKILAISILAGLMVGPLEGFADVWGGEFLKNVYKMRDNDAASLTSLIFLGMCFGIPIIGVITEKTKKDFLIIITCAVGMIISFLFILTDNLSYYVLAALFMLIGALSSYQIIAISKVISYVNKEISSLAAATANMIIMIFGYFFHSLIGKIIIYYHHLPAHLAFSYGIALLPFCLFIAAIGFSILAYRQRLSES